MANQIDWTLSFQQIKESPSTYQGSVVLLGGEILNAKRLKDHTRIIVLQLPLSPGEEPVTNRTQSKGTFYRKANRVSGSGNDSPWHTRDRDRRGIWFDHRIVG